MSPEIVLLPLGERQLASLLATAVADADPTDVMPPVAGEPGWNSERRKAFLAFHRSRWIQLPSESSYVVLVDGFVVGAARLAPVSGSDDLKAGVWLGRSYRRGGIGTVVFALLRTQALEQGAQRIIANTTIDNIGTNRILTRGGTALSSNGETGVRAVIDLMGQEGSPTAEQPAGPQR